MGKGLRERAGVVYEILGPAELVMDCSCSILDEYATVHFRKPHRFELKPGDWIKVWIGEPYNRETVGFNRDIDIFEVDAERIERTSRVEEIHRLEEQGKTDCYWYKTLLQGSETIRTSKD